MTKDLFKLSIAAIMALSFVGCDDDSSSDDNGDACTENAIKCADDGSSTQICKNGEWGLGQACDNGCENNACKAKSEEQPGNDCTNGQKKCSGSGISTMVCTNGRWVTGEACDNGCADGVCKADTSDKCDAGAKKCADDGSKVLVCENNAWKDGDACSNGCADGACKTNTSDKCNAGAKKCADDGSKVLVCEEEAWKDGEACDNGCDAGACKPADVFVCSDGSKKCSDDGKKIVVCENNAWKDSDACAYGCDAGTCKPENMFVCADGAKKCSDDGTKTFVCENNAWKDGDACSNGCESGACKANASDVCSDGAKKCADDGSKIVVCSSNDWKDGDTCVNGCADGACKPADAIICNEGAKKCADDGSKVLNCIGNDWRDGDACSNGCDAGVCKPADVFVCSDGAKKCNDDGTKIVVCDGNAWKDGDACSNGCESGACKADSGIKLGDACTTANETTCIGDIWAVCDKTTKKWEEGVDCAEMGLVCRNTTTDSYTCVYTVDDQADCTKNGDYLLDKTECGLDYNDAYVVLYPVICDRISSSDPFYGVINFDQPLSICNENDLIYCDAIGKVSRVSASECGTCEYHNEDPSYYPQSECEDADMIRAREYDSSVCKNGRLAYYSIYYADYLCMEPCDAAAKDTTRDKCVQSSNKYYSYTEKCENIGDDYIWNQVGSSTPCSGTCNEDFTACGEGSVVDVSPHLPAYDAECQAEGYDYAIQTSKTTYACFEACSKVNDTKDVCETDKYGSYVATYVCTTAGDVSVWNYQSYIDCANSCAANGTECEGGVVVDKCEIGAKDVVCETYGPYAYRVEYVCSNEDGVINWVYSDDTECLGGCNDAGTDCDEEGVDVSPHIPEKDAECQAKGHDYAVATTSGSTGCFDACSNANDKKSVCITDEEFGSYTVNYVCTKVADISVWNYQSDVDCANSCAANGTECDASGTKEICELGTIESDCQTSYGSALHVDWICSNKSGKNDWEVLDYVMCNNACNVDKTDCDAQGNMSSLCSEDGSECVNGAGVFYDYSDYYEACSFDEVEEANCPSGSACVFDYLLYDIDCKPQCDPSKDVNKAQVCDKGFLDEYTCVEVEGNYVKLLTSEAACLTEASEDVSGSADTCCAAGLDTENVFDGMYEMCSDEEISAIACASGTACVKYWGATKGSCLPFETCTKEGETRDVCSSDNDEVETDVCTKIGDQLVWLDMVYTPCK